MARFQDQWLGWEIIPSFPLSLPLGPLLLLFFAPGLAQGSCLRRLPLSSLVCCFRICLPPLFSAIPNLPDLRQLPTHALEVKSTLNLGLPSPPSPMPFPFILSLPCQNLPQFCSASQVRLDPPALCSRVPISQPTCGNIPWCPPKGILRGPTWSLCALL